VKYPSISNGQLTSTRPRQQIEAYISEIQSELLPDTKVDVEKMNPSTLAVMGYSLEGKRSQVELKKNSTPPSQTISRQYTRSSVI
jgi:hypothetical protein